MKKIAVYSALALALAELVLTNDVLECEWLQLF